MPLRGIQLQTHMVGWHARDGLACLLSACEKGALGLVSLLDGPSLGFGIMIAATLARGLPLMILMITSLMLLQRESLRDSIMLRLLDRSFALIAAL